MIPIHHEHRRFVLPWLVVACGACIWAGSVSAQEDDVRLIDRNPFDRVSLDQRNNNAELDVLPLKFESIPNPRPAGTLEFRFAQDPELHYEVPWVNIVAIKFYRDLLLDKANELTQADKFDEAYFYFDRLIQRYPKTTGLAPAYRKYLSDDAARTLADAKSLRQQAQETDAQKRFHEALGIVEELIRLSPNESPPDMLREILGGLLFGYVEQKKNYAAARDFLDRISATYGDQQKPVLDVWRGKLMTAATARRDAAEAHIKDGKARAAHEAVRQMMNIYPAVEGGSAIVAEVMRTFPLVMVGVTQPAVSFDSRGLDDWAARRAGLLTHRSLFEYSSRGPEGGRYVSPLGLIEPGEDATQLILHIDATSTRTDVPRADGFEVARLLRDAATPNDANYLPAWSQLMESVSVRGVKTVVIQLRYPHILPEALMQIPLEPLDAAGKADGLYVVAPSQDFENELNFVANPRYPSTGKRNHIVERTYSDSNAAVTALRQGEIDVIDRVFPGDVARLAANSDIVVQRYEMPSLHMLVPSGHNAYMANETFRRALSYAIDRQRILDFELLNNQPIPGCEMISGPFPKGIPTEIYRSDPLAYAYNHRALPRGYSPRLAITLIELADRHIVEPVRTRYEATKSEFELLEKLENVDPRRRDEVGTRFTEVEREYNKLRTRPTLVIAHRADDIPRIACQGIADQLRVAGIECVVLEVPPGESVDDDGRWLLFSTSASIVKDLRTGTVPSEVSTTMRERQFGLSEEVVVEENNDGWRILDLKDGRSYSAEVDGDRVHVYVNVDLRYLEIFMWEPLIDARKLLAVDGIASLGSAHTELALRRLDRAVNWSLARRYLFELHSLAQRNGMVIPLWQTVEHYAHHKSVQGIGTRLLSLYQNVRDWEISAANPLAGAK